MFTDFVLNGTPEGAAASVLADVQWDPGMLRPFVGDDGRKYVTLNTRRTAADPKTGRRVPVRKTYSYADLIRHGHQPPVANAAGLRKDEWVEVDRVVLQAYRQRLRAWADLAGANTFTLDGMARTILEHETVDDGGEAVVDMDGMTQGRNAEPQYGLEGLPLPITHSDFFVAARHLAISRRNGTGVDTTKMERAARRVAEKVEQTVIGTATGVVYGADSRYSRTSQVYGYLTHPNRLTKTNMATPTGSNPETTVANVLAAREQLYAAKLYGPFMIYHSTDWDQYLDNDYARLGGNNASMTLRDRLRKIDDVVDVRRLDYLVPAANPFTMLVVQMTPDVARAVVGMPLTTVQWPESGGMRLHFKVMCIHVPQIRADKAGNCGVLQATTS